MLRHIEHTEILHSADPPPPMDIECDIFGDTRSAWFEQWEWFSTSDMRSFSVSDGSHVFPLRLYQFGNRFLSSHMFGHGIREIKRTATSNLLITKALNRI
jgi:hypothetical protein